MFLKDGHKHILSQKSFQALLLLHQQVESDNPPLESGQNCHLLVINRMQWDEGPVTSEAKPYMVMTLLSYLPEHPHVGS